MAPRLGARGRVDAARGPSPRAPSSPVFPSSTYLATPRRLIRKPATSEDTLHTATASRPYLLDRRQHAIALTFSALSLFASTAFLRTPACATRHAFFFSSSSVFNPDNLVETGSISARRQASRGDQHAHQRLTRPV